MPSVRPNRCPDIIYYLHFISNRLCLVIILIVSEPRPSQVDSRCVSDQTIILMARVWCRRIPSSVPILPTIGSKGSMSRPLPR